MRLRVRLATFIFRLAVPRESAMAVQRAERPVSRQPVCRYCDHEEHVHTRCHALLDGDGTALCPCPPHHPIGVYT